MRKPTAAALCAAFCLALLLCLTGCGAAQATSAPAAATAAEPVMQITVSASGSVRLVPDKASVSFGVTTQEASAEEAQSKNSEAVNKVIEALTGRGIEEKSIRTVNYSLYPQYDWSVNGEQRLIGYTVTTTMSVQDQNIEDLGQLLTACVAAGINRVDSVSFFCSDYDEAYRQALAQAVTASRDKAEALATAGGKRLGDAVSITEGWQDSSARYSRSVNSLYDVAAEASLAAPSFEPGETEIIANVTVTYRMR